MTTISQSIWIRLEKKAFFFGVLITVYMGVFPLPTNYYTLVIPIIFISLFGLPHGALDYKLLKHLLPKKRQLAAVSGYITLVIATVFLWSLFPDLMFISFLIMSAYHFGGDWPLNFSRRIINGLIILGLPTIFYPQEVMIIFEFLVSGSGAILIVNSLQIVTVICGIHLIIMILFKRLSSNQCLEILLLGILSSVAPPLIYFTTYFCLFHSLKHFSEISVLLNKASPMRLLRLSLPVTAITLTIGFIALVILTKFFRQLIDQSLFQVTFIGLAALTVPHMVLVEWMRFKKATK